MTVQTRRGSARRWPRLLPLFLLLCAACGPGRAPAPDSAAPPVVIVALDGLSWQVAGPLVRNGEMPELAGLIRDGAAGPLETDRPTWTPVIFTTMATGKEPGEHGINAFVSSEGIPLTSNIRRVPALWNILSSLDQPTLFFGWPVTWPAEEVLGEMISDRWHKSRQRHVYPETSDDWLAPALQTFRDAAADPPPELQRLGQLATSDRVSPFLHGTFEGEGTAGENGPGEPDRLVLLTREKVDTGFLWNATLDSEVKLPLFLQRFPVVRPRLSAVYFNATDMSQHFFGGADRPAEGCLPERNDAGREVIDETYRVYDRLLGRLVQGVREVEGYQECVFVVLSDHGIDLASGLAVRWRPPAGEPAGGEAPVQSLLAGELDGLARLEPPADSGWHRLRFPPGGTMAQRSRVLNRLKSAGCEFHPDDVYIYFVHDEAPAGVVVISGGRVAGGQTISSMSVADVAPTVLALLGLPAARDMAGRPAALRLMPDQQGEPRVLQTTLLPTYGATPPATEGGEAISSPEDETIRDELKAMGYIE